MSRGYKKRMVKKIKIEAIIEIKDESHVDDALLKRTISPIGEIESCNIISQFSENFNDRKEEMLTNEFYKKFIALIVLKFIEQ